MEGFGLFFYDTPFKNCIFSMVALIARRSKYDFWIPDEILTLEQNSDQKKHEVENVDRKKKTIFFYHFFYPKIGENQFFRKNDFFDFWIGKMFDPKKNPDIFVRSKFSTSFFFLI